MQKKARCITYEGFKCSEEYEHPNRNFFAWGTSPLSEDDIIEGESAETEIGIDQYPGLGRAYGDLIPPTRIKIMNSDNSEK